MGTSEELFEQSGEGDSGRSKPARFVPTVQSVWHQDLLTAQMAAIFMM